MPYITASIILQLLQVVVPSLEKLSKEGEVGQARITQYTRYLTVALAFAQSIGYVFLFRSFQANAGQPVVEKFDAPHVFLIVVSLTAGTILLMWLASSSPTRHRQRHLADDLRLDRRQPAPRRAGLVDEPGPGLQGDDAVPRLAVIAGIVFIQEGQRRIPVQYAKRVIGRRMTSGGQTYLPLRVNMAGVIPVIFAASLMAFPPTVGQLINTPATKSISNFFSPNGWAYVVGESVFIILFTYFYTAVTSTRSTRRTT